MRICIVGLGYVGLPLANEFAENGIDVIGFDIDEKRIDELTNGIDSTNEIGKVNSSIYFTTDPSKMGDAEFIIITVPTPVKENNEPDLKPIESAAKTIAPNMKKGAIIILESTVYPGLTEEFLSPLLEKHSELKAHEDFKMAYSPERVNPGDKEHTIDKIIKVVSGEDEETLEKVAELYSKICKAGVHRAPNIRTAEAAKVIENIQRDLNIALMNELSIIFEKMGISTKDVIEAAGTKWNFHKYSPGMVGGHCIPVDPYYLVYKSKQLGYDPKIILAGRAVNNNVPHRIAEWVEESLKKAGKNIRGAKIYVMGLTFKENVPDLRTSPAIKLIEVLKKEGAEVICYDPLIADDEVKAKTGLPNTPPEKSGNFDCVVLAVPHRQFKELTLGTFEKHMHPSIILDLKGVFENEYGAGENVIYKSL